MVIPFALLCQDIFISTSVDAQHLHLLTLPAAEERQSFPSHT